MKEPNSLATFLYQGIKVDVTHHTLHALFERQVRLTPRRKAVVFGNASLTYKQLNTKANQLAHQLLRHGVRKGTLVGVFIERSIHVIVAIFAILKAGGAFLVIDKDSPSERINFILRDSALSFVVADSKNQDCLLQHFTKRRITLINSETTALSSCKYSKNVSLPLSGNNLAYVIYTSGTTGKPKGILIDHQGLLNTLLNQLEIVKILPDDTVLCAFPFLFDASIWEMGGALLAGACLCLTTHQERKSVKMLSNFIKKHKITVATLTPSMLRLLPSSALATVRCLISAGEACTFDLLDKVGKNCLFYNAYGPSEVSICATIGAVTKQDISISLGAPLKNVTVYVLKDNLQPALQGEIGTLYIGGIGLARGYLNNPKLTSERFLRNPFDMTGESRLYNTGDLVRINTAGTLEYIGRKDDEIKIRGNRVNLNEIQNLLMQHPQVKSSIVKAIPHSRKTRIVAIVETDDELLNFKQVRHYLQPFLPVYMLPNKLVKRKEFPLSFNGKVGAVSFE